MANCNPMFNFWLNFLPLIHSWKTMKPKKRFLENIMLFVIMGFLPLRKLNLFGCKDWFFIMLEDEFPIQVLLTLVNKNLINYVQSALAECMIATCIFNLKVFMVDVNLLSTNWGCEVQTSLTSFHSQKILTLLV
jgi:hypothetical protein